jgi:hypothetical protein
MVHNFVRVIGFNVIAQHSGKGLGLVADCIREGRVGHNLFLTEGDAHCRFIEDRDIWREGLGDARWNKGKFSSDVHTRALGHR